MISKILKKAAGSWFLLIMVVALLVSSAIPAEAAGSDAADLAQVRTLLANGYVDPVPQSVLSAPTIDGMLAQLNDPYTDYFSPTDYQDFQDSLSNQFSGIGIHMTMTSDGVGVVSVIAGSPAEKAGLQPGDIITRANAHPLNGLTAGAAANLLRGPQGTVVQISVMRGSKLLFMSVTRAALAEPEVTGQMLDGHIGYIQISVFGSAVPEAFAQTATGLEEKGADSWIVDLRDNPGGYMNAAVALAGDFIPGLSVVQVQARYGGTQVFTAPASTVHIKGPVILLTNRNSASASEILTAALKDHDAALVLGEKTFGKGSVQNIYPFTDGAALKMTIAHFFSPAGHPINKVGIKPDLPVDPAVAEEAAELLLAQSAGVSGELPGSQGGAQARLYLQGRIFTVSLAMARETKYWPAWQAILAGAPAQAQFMLSGQAGWSSVTQTQVGEEWPMYFPDSQMVGEVDNPPLDRSYTLAVPQPADTPGLSPEAELVDAQSGEVIPTILNASGRTTVRVTPVNSLQPGKTYWLLYGAGGGQDQSGTPSGMEKLMQIRTFAP